MNLQPLYVTARVMQAVYRIASTALLLAYLARRKDERPRHPLKRHEDRLDR